jgi:hypothetical protein
MRRGFTPTTVVRVKRRGPIEFAAWGALLGAVVGMMVVPDHFSLATMTKFIGVYAVGGGIVGLVAGVLAVGTLGRRPRGDDRGPVDGARMAPSNEAMQRTPLRGAADLGR